MMTHIFPGHKNSPFIEIIIFDAFFSKNAPLGFVFRVRFWGSVYEVVRGHKTETPKNEPPKLTLCTKYQQISTLNVCFFSWELQINFRVQFNAKQSSNPKQVTLFRNIDSPYP